MESDSEVTTGGISGQPTETVFDSSTICGFPFSLYPTACITSFYGSRRMLNEQENQEESVDYLKEEAERRNAG